MDDICESNPDWFNLLTFDKESRKFILTYLKSKNSSSYRCYNKKFRKHYCYCIFFSLSNMFIYFYMLL